ncbi:unnamed protein product [Effrenium voratum]|uniref:Clathrin/coatomer adaptor adaptin-like N-terminal domain-containing protein n=1 Tax=Effrenium voratum TaxID=2562239 RepID=A0AA36ILW1_9DINO|nr:unnamed protein product [Effrenium voratum]
MRGAQETLGFDSPSYMKGLQVFIADIRNCQTKEQEQQRVEKELSKIRLKFANPKSLSGYDKKKYVWKLLYAYMLGYEIDFGHFQAVELCSASKFSEKTAGYLATSLLLADNNDMVRMIVNSVKTDMASGNEVWQKKLATMFLERDIGLLTSASGFMLGILEMGKFPAATLDPRTLGITAYLRHGCREVGSCAMAADQAAADPVLQFFPVVMFDAELLHRLNVMLQTILAKPSSQRSPAPPPGEPRPQLTEVDAERQNRSNAEHAILFEAMNLMIHLEDTADPETMRTAAGLLGIFLSSTDPNIRYLGLETMARLATNLSTHEYLDRYKNQILDKMHETDISIRRQALNLLYALCRPENWQQIVDELLEILGASDTLLQEELVLKIAILAEKNAPNFGWYVDVVFKMLESAPDAVADDVWYRVVQVVTGFEDGLAESEKHGLQRHAASKAYQNLTSQRAPHDTLLRLGAYLMGEFGHLLPQSVMPRAKFEALHRHFQRGSQQTKAIVLLACVKLLNANDALKGDVVSFLKEIQDA